MAFRGALAAPGLSDLQPKETLTFRYDNAMKSSKKLQLQLTGPLNEGMHGGCLASGGGVRWRVGVLPERDVRARQARSCLQQTQPKLSTSGASSTGELSGFHELAVGLSCPHRTP